MVVVASRGSFVDVRGLVMVYHSVKTLRQQWFYFLLSAFWRDTGWSTSAVSGWEIYSSFLRS
jgi:hypothetical protein